MSLTRYFFLIILLHYIINKMTTLITHVILELASGMYLYDGLINFKNYRLHTTFQKSTG